MARLLEARSLDRALPRRPCSRLRRWLRFQCQPEQPKLPQALFSVRGSPSGANEPPAGMCTSAWPLLANTHPQHRLGKPPSTRQSVNYAPPACPLIRLAAPRGATRSATGDHEPSLPPAGRLRLLLLRGEGGGEAKGTPEMSPAQQMVAQRLETPSPWWEGSAYAYSAYD